jgi:hypothetical protein
MSICAHDETSSGYIERRAVVALGEKGIIEVASEQL